MFNNIIKFLREVQVEFKNITWPTKETLIQLSIVVISISIVISLILGGFDYLFTKSFGLLTQPKQPTESTINLPPPESTDSADIKTEDNAPNQ